MKTRRMLTPIAAVLALLTGSASATTLIYNDFSSVAGLQLNGDAAQAGNVLRVTPAYLTTLSVTPANPSLTRGSSLQLKGPPLDAQKLQTLRSAAAAQGYRVRTYVPYGEYWYPYFMRRLAERPANLWFFVSNFFKG